MNSALDLLEYASKHKIMVAVDGDQIKLEGQFTDEFLETARQHKPELLEALSTLPNDGKSKHEAERWNPELATQGYVWCLDCKHFDSVNCNHTDNPFHTVEKQPLAPRLCQWYEVKLNPD